MVASLLRGVAFAVLSAAVLLAAPAARAAQVFVVLDSGADMGIATALMADGHSVTVSSDEWAAGSNPALTGDLSAYDVIFWSQDGPSYGEAVTDAALFTNLTDWVMAGGRILVTGYDSVASPSDPMLVAFLGATTSSDVVGPPGVIASIDCSLTTGVVDIRGVTPTGGVGDTDHMNGLMADTQAICPSASGTGQQWTLRTLGAGEIAYISNGSSSASWTNTAAGGAGAFNAAIRNFAASAGAACMGEGTACMSAGGAAGLCRAGRCCTGCWDGARCRAGTAATECGARGAACASCADTDLCTSDVCTAGVCSNPDAPSGTACDDGVFCTATDRCDGAGTCLGTGARCDDLESCTVDACDEAMDRCTNTGMADSTACTSGAASGLCRSSRCCTGCWDGAACQTGATAAACGVRGVACTSCIDGVACSSDVCTAGICSNPDAPSGTTCDDGMYCTPTDRCNATRTCVGSGVRCTDGADCTTDTCDEATDMCVFTPDTGCTIGGVCVATGTVNPTYPCQVCDPTRSGTDWSFVLEGTACGPARCVTGRVTTRTCNASGTCVMSPASPCPTGVCADATSCEPGCTAGSCPAGEWCNPASTLCEVLGAAGAACTLAEGCTSGTCTDGVCCDAACDGACEACHVAGLAGTCSPVPAGEDPDDECVPGTCDGAGACSGTDAGVPTDGGGPAPDAGMIMVADGGPADAGMRRTTRRSGGCGCAVPASGRGELPLALLALVVLGLLRRKRR